MLRLRQGRFAGVEGDGHREGGPLAQGAPHGDLPAHAGDQVFHNGHSQPGPHDLLGPEEDFPLVGVEELGQELRRHAGPRVRDDEEVVVPLSLVHLPQDDGDVVPRPGELHGVGHQVVDDLAQAGGVALDHLVLYVDGDLKILVLGFGLGLEGGDAVGQRLAQVEGLDLHGDVALLQAGNLQNVVNQGQKLLAGRPDLVQVAHHLLTVAVVLEGQAGHADDDVQRGAHVMAHNGEELLLGLFALLRGGQGALQQADLPLLLLLLVLHVPETDNHLIGHLLRVGEHPHTDPALLLTELAQELAAEVPGTLLHQPL